MKSLNNTSYSSKPTIQNNYSLNQSISTTKGRLTTTYTGLSNKIGIKDNSQSRLYRNSSLTNTKNTLNNSNHLKTSGSLNNTVNLTDDLSTKSNTAKKSSRTPISNLSQDKKSSREDVEVSKRLS